MSDDEIEVIDKNVKLPTGLQIKYQILEIGWDVPKLVNYCVRLRNQAMASTSEFETDHSTEPPAL
jgi:hypothetical protein